MAYPKSNLDQYRVSAVNSASPLQLVIMLYDGAMKHMAAGKRAMLQANVFEQNQCLQKAQRIIAELISCLDMQKGGDVASNLLALYSFCYNKLVESNVEDNPEGIDQASEVLANLRTSWVELDKSTRQTALERHEVA